MKKIFILLLCLLSYFVVNAQTWEQLHKQGEDLVQNNKLKEAIEIFEKAKKQAEIEFGTKHANYINSLNELGGHYKNTGQLAKAEPLLIQARAIQEETRPVKDEQMYATTLSTLADVYNAKGLFNQADFLFNKAREVLKNNKSFLEYAKVCNDLGFMYYNQGIYSKAEELYKEAMPIVEKLEGKENIYYATLTNNLGEVYRLKGLFAEAEPLFMESIILREKLFGKKSQSYATALNNLALVYIHQHLVEKAIPMLIESKNIREGIFGKEHPAYTGSCNNLAQAYIRIDKYDLAESLFLEATSINEKVLGKEHPQYAASVANLAFLYNSQKKYEQAEKYLIVSKNIREKKLGKEHPSYAQSCYYLALNYISQKKLDEAEPLLLEAKEIREKLFEKGNHEYSQNIFQLGLVYFLPSMKRENFDLAKKCFLQDSEALFINLTENYAVLSENEKVTAYQKFQGRLDTYNYFGANYFQKDPELLEWLYNNQIMFKNLIFRTSSIVKKKILDSKDSNSIRLYETWIAKKEHLSKAYTLSIKEQERRNINLKTLQSQCDSLERILVVKSKDFESLLDKEVITWKDIKAKLGKNELAIEIIKFNKENAPTTYAALLIHKNSKTPDIIFLDEKKDLDGLSLTYYNNALKVKKEDKLSYDAYWLPIAQKTKGYKTIYLSPEGVYHQISLNALLNPKTQKYLGQEVDIRLISNTKEILTLKKKKEASVKNVSIFAYPKYKKNKPDDRKQESNKDKELSRFFDESDVKELKGTKIEAEQIEKILQRKNIPYQKFLEENANESNIKKLQNPSVLHIATHGFFINKKINKASDLLESPNSHLSHNFEENLLLHSGLLLAGAQDGIAEGSTNTILEQDGILTAYEAQNINLGDCSLVVLSACETGKGDQKIGDGVFGLQRAFQSAGARSVIMSLWKVDDVATQKLMAAFYKNWLEKKQDKRKSLSNAQKTLKKEYKHPYYWAAFVLVGE